MEDVKIVQLYWDRNESAITETSSKYGSYCTSIAQKRGDGQIPAVLDELSECVSGKENVHAEVEYHELVKAIDVFLDSLSPQKRSMFVCRYWYNDSISEIAKQFHMRENAVSMTLRRIRVKLQKYLVERGYEV